MQIEPIKLMPVKSSAQMNFSNTDSVETKGFNEYFAEALQNVNDLQLKGQQANLDLAAGRVDDISKVVVATEKAGIALQLTMQIRNKAVDAYQEIMRMQV